MIAVVSIAKKNDSGDVLSEQHLLLNGPEPMLCVEGMTGIINVADYNLAETGPKAYTCPRFCREIVDVMRDVRDAFRFAVSREAIEFDVELDQMVDHYYEVELHRENDNCFCELWADGIEIDQDPNAFEDLKDRSAEDADLGGISFQDRLALEDSHVRVDSETIWQSQSQLAEPALPRDVVSTGSVPQRA